jgi:hypothetical protein
MYGGSAGPICEKFRESEHDADPQQVDGVTYAWSAKLDATDVTFTTTAFTGGSIAASATVTSSGSTAASQTYAANATIALP